MRTLVLTGSLQELAQKLGISAEELLSVNLGDLLNYPKKELAYPDAFDARLERTIARLRSPRH